MSILIGHASSDENRKAHGGKAGDQTGGEVCTRSWYSSPWDLVLRCKDSVKAEKMAKACEAACANKNIGYDQYQRNTLLPQAKAVNWDLSKVSVACECDCSSLMTVCAQCAGIDVPYVYGNSPYTGNMKTQFMSTGYFEALTNSKYLTSDKYLKRGDILVRTSGHTAMALENGSGASSDTTKPTTTTTPTISTTVSNNRIDTVMEVQKWANTNYKFNLEVDGIYGKETKKALVKILQTELNKNYGSKLEVDGVWGNETKKACVTVKKGSKNNIVAVLQALLVCNQIDGIYVDGDYGSITVAAVKSYQAKVEIVKDGKAGKNTFAKLCS